MRIVLGGRPQVDPLPRYDAEVSNDARPQPPIDEYEQKFMGPDEGLLFAEKATRPRWWNKVFAATALFLAGANLVDPVNGWHALAVGGPPLLAAWLILPVLRVGVTKKNVRVQLGVWGPTIPVANIIDRELVAAGTDKPPRGFVYNVGGGKGGLVKITWRKEAGAKQRVTWVSVDSGRAMVSAVREAMAQSGAPGAGRPELAAPRTGEDAVAVPGPAKARTTEVDG